MVISKEEMQRQSSQYRRTILDFVYSTKKGHIGGCYSCIDILTMLYFGKLLSYDAQNPEWENRDRFLLSKGHCALALYVVLSDVGFFDRSVLKSFGQNGSYLGAHPDFRLAGVEVSSGSLGNGLGIAAGMALADRYDEKARNTVVLTGDGECYEGSVWEGAMLAGHHKLKNLIWFVDRNRQCVLDYTEDINQLDFLNDALPLLGWDVLVVDGHNFDEYDRLKQNIESRERKKPLCIIANTIKGKGVSFMEQRLEWHHKVPSMDEYKRAIDEIERAGLCRMK